MNYRAEKRRILTSYAAHQAIIEITQASNRKSLSSAKKLFGSISGLLQQWSDDLDGELSPDLSVYAESVLSATYSRFKAFDAERTKVSTHRYKKILDNNMSIQVKNNCIFFLVSELSSAFLVDFNIFRGLVL
jgi:hypothetical protein